MFGGVGLCVVTELHQDSNAALWSFLALLAISVGLTEFPRQALTFSSSCLSFPSSQMAGLCHQAQ